LQQEGFAVSPAERLRVQRLLAAQNRLLLSDPGRQELKYLLAPILCRNKPEQAAFYKVYDRFLESLRETPEETKPTGAEQAREAQPFYEKWLMPMLWVAVLLYAVAFGWHRWSQRPARALNVTFQEVPRPEGAEPSDTIRFRNTTAPEDTLGVDFLWSVYVIHDDQRFQIDRNRLQYTVVLIDSLKWAYTYTVSLEAIDRTAHQITRSQRSFDAVCLHPPKVSGAITFKGEPVPGKQLTFALPKDVNPAWVLHWNFGDGKESDLRTPIHTWQEAGRYTVALTLTDTFQAGRCSIERTLSLDIGNELPQLTELPLVRDPLDRSWVYTWWVWLLIGALAILSAWLFRLWAHRPYTEVETHTAPIPQALREALNPPDRAPYAIPFRPNHQHIRLSEEALQLAGSMRGRQEGERAELHIPSTVKATIDRMGFMDLKFAVQTRPSDYLILIDQQSDFSHQARLFKYLADLLGEQDVLFEVFWYRMGFGPLWNTAYPGGLTLEQLQFLFGQKRLVIFGDGHALLQNSGSGSAGPLHAGWAPVFKKWTHRLVVTPVPLASWQYQEARLYTLFALFPADLVGLLQAAAYIEAGMVEEELPATLREWEKKLAQKTTRVGTDRLWRTAEDHEHYLKDHPGLFRWLRALSVYPEPSWNITIAIGKALGVAVNYENLLTLARIPWLQTGALKPSLWRELSRGLPAAEEERARRAVKAELESVQEISAGGFANLKLQTRLAVQDFALTPDSESAKEAIRFLLQKTKPAPMLLEELDRIVLRRYPAIGAGQAAGDLIRRYLKQEPVRTQPLITRAIILAIATGLLAVAMLACRLFVPASQVAGLFHPDQQADRPLRHWGLVKEEKQEADEAQRLHNLAVDTWEARDFHAGEWKRAAGFTYEGAGTQSAAAAQLFGQALQLRAAYPLARLNQAKLWYDDGLRLLYRPQPDYNLAKDCFRKAMAADSLRLRAMEGLALAHYNAGALDSACALMDSIGQLDPTYVHQLRVRGLCGNQNAIVADIAPIIHGRVLSADEPAKPLVGVLVSGGGLQFRTDANGAYDLRLPANFPSGKILLIYTHKGLETLRQIQVIDGVKQLPDVFMKGIQADRDGDGIPDLADLCPDVPGVAAWKGCPDAVSLLKVAPPTRDIILGALADFQYDQNPGVQENEAQRMLKQLGIAKIDRGRANAEPYYYGRFESGYTIMLWVGTYGKTDRYGVRYGSADYGYVKNDETYFEIIKDDVLDPEDDVVQIIKTIMDANFLKMNLIAIKSETAVNASAAISNGKRYIIYNPSFIDQIKKNAGTDWAVFYVFAYEIGIHLSNHQFDANDPAIRKEQILEGDVFAGGALYRLGASLKDAQAGVSVLKEGESETHPARIARLEAVASGWTRAKEQSGGMQPAPVVIPGTTIHDASSDDGMVFVKGGAYTMGCTGEQGSDCGDDEKPAHQVTVKDFYIGKYEVTQAEWQKVMGRNSSTFQDCDQCPVENVSYYDIQEFINKLNAQTGRIYRLPTETEWEYAARGGQKSKGYKDAGSDNLDEVAWYSENSQGKTHHVGVKKPNELGVFDMNGNVREWCNDWYYDYSLGVTRPPGPASGDRVNRGGSWFNGAQRCRVSVRGYGTPGYRSSDLGFRLASSPK
jgi:formylglycine-generating enzyme required for sulfatase activity